MASEHRSTTAKRFGPLGVVGWPIAHTLSPAIHNAALEHVGWDQRYVYTALPVKPEDAGQALAGMQALGFVGCNITVPHKETLFNLVQKRGGSITATALAAGAANTLAFGEDGSLAAHNTDVAGFLAGLAFEGRAVRETRVVVFGAGGAARAVCLGFALMGARELVIVNRTEPRALALKATMDELMYRNPERVELAAAELLGELEELLPGSKEERVKQTNHEPTGAQRFSCSVIGRGTPHDAALAEVLSRADVVVNCTPLGMEPYVDGCALGDVELDRLQPGALVFDTVYRPRRTRLVELAAQRGIDAVSGLSMLVAQAALSWRLWFGTSGPFEVMRQVAENVVTG